MALSEGRVPSPERVYLVTRGIYSDERAAGVYPSFERAKGQFPGAEWSNAFDPSMWHADNIVVGHWDSGAPIVDAVTIYEMSFDQDIKAMKSR